VTSETAVRGSARQVRVWEPGWPCPVAQILLQQRRGAGDPTYKVDLAGRHWRGIRTPVGVATLVVESRPREGEVCAAAWGPGAEWALAQLPDLLGASDDPSGFDPRHPVLAAAWRQHQHWRLGRTGLVMESLVPSIIEQKVTGQEAFAGFRALVRRFGERAPGPGHDLDLWVQPTPEALRAVPSWEWLKLHVDPARSRAVVLAARVAQSLERIVGCDAAEADRRLCSQPGIGVWTSAEVRARVLGDADAVSFGDYHVAKDIGWALTGEPVTDEQLEELLAPWRPHRGRVQALVSLAGLHRPRHGPRMAPRTHLPR
jgi:3-methyladenine DNA glycosylase/8-oxoguanine DNA glycosylase